MKKILYGILILIGGSVIASNFMVDNSKLDHKRVSASGTICKWISESGYGVGPYYTNSNVTGTCASSGTNCSIDGDLNLGNFIDIVPCNTSIVLQTIDGNKLYASINDDDFFTGYIRFDLAQDSSARNTAFLKFSNGVLNVIKTSTSASIENYSDSNFNNTISGPKNLFSNYSMNLASSFNTLGYHSDYNDYTTDINGDGEWTFTCVCAEY